MAIGDAALGNAWVQAALAEFRGVESPGKEAAFVPERFGLNKVAAGEPGLVKDQLTTSVTGTGMTNWPPQLRM